MRFSAEILAPATLSHLRGPVFRVTQTRRYRPTFPEIATAPAQLPAALSVLLVAWHLPLVWGTRKRQLAPATVKTRGCSFFFFAAPFETDSTLLPLSASGFCPRHFFARPDLSVRCSRLPHQPLARARLGTLAVRFQPALAKSLEPADRATPAATDTAGHHNTARLTVPTPAPLHPPVRLGRPLSLVDSARHPLFLAEKPLRHASTGLPTLPAEDAHFRDPRWNNSCLFSLFARAAEPADSAASQHFPRIAHMSIAAGHLV